MMFGGILRRRNAVNGKWLPRRWSDFSELTKAALQAAKGSSPPSCEAAVDGKIGSTTRLQAKGLGESQQMSSMPDSFSERDKAEIYEDRGNELTRVVGVA